MAKLVFTHIINTTYTAGTAGADKITAARAAFPLLTKASSTVAELLALDRQAQDTRAALDAGDVTIAAGLRSILASNDVDVTNTRAVSKALAADVWLDSALEPVAIALEKKHPGATIKPETKPAAGTPALKYYDKLTQRINRLSKAVVGVPKAPRVAASTAKVRVSGAITAAVVAQKNAGQTKAEIKAQLLAALDRAFA
ncbi:MAG TPA: hypothetical protein VJR90_00065 [Gammaproteobacteria bacterium]|nr:hypothetical protein [Gammaproteobacteria bacterium]